jgi:GxxExxY protein
MEIFGLCDIVRQTSVDIHCFHRHGHLEKVYENALVHRLRKLGLDVKQQHPLTILDEDGTVIGDYYADQEVHPDPGTCAPSRFQSLASLIR